VTVIKAKEGSEAVLEFLDSLENLRIERTARPEFAPVSKEELWLKAKTA